MVLSTVWYGTVHLIHATSLTNVPLCLQNSLYVKFELQNPVRLRQQTCWTNEEVQMDLLVSHWMVRPT